MRDLVLAQKYAEKGNHIIFATQNLEGNINHKIKEAGYEIHKLNSSDVEELDKLIKTLNIDLLVIDHYGIDAKQEKKLKIKNKKLKIMVLDDTYEKHYCDILLNHNISANKKRYKGLVPKNCELRCGKKYTLLRDEFIQEIYKKKWKTKRYKKQNDTTTIFIAMGGADHSNINIDILKVIKKLKNNSKIEVNLVTTTANKNLKNLEKYCKHKSWIKLYINSNKIAKLMSQSNLAIVTPSVSVNEVYFMKLPFVAIKTAENQNDMYTYLKKTKFNILKKFNDKKILKILKNILKKNND